MTHDASSRYGHTFGPYHRPGRDPLACDRYVTLMDVETGGMQPVIVVNGHVDEKHPIVHGYDYADANGKIYPNSECRDRTAKFHAQQWANQKALDTHFEIRPRSNDPVSTPGSF